MLTHFYVYLLDSFDKRACTLLKKSFQFIGITLSNSIAISIMINMMKEDVELLVLEQNACATPLLSEAGQASCSHVSLKMTFKSFNISKVKAFLRYFVTKTSRTLFLNTQYLPALHSYINYIDNVIYLMYINLLN